MKTLTINQLKPNPAGKDRPRVGPLDPSQLAAEWVDIKNTGNCAIDLGGVQLYDRAFSASHPEGEWRAILTLERFSLPPARTLRVHSGRNRGIAVIRAEDREGSDYFIFTGRDEYVWNNKEGDTAALWDSYEQRTIDAASYDPNPPDGVILVRVGAKLQPAYIPAWLYR